MLSAATRPALALSALLLLGSSAWASHFTSRRASSGGQEHGIVVSHGMDLFEITAAAGGYSAARRAEIVAGRLEELSESHALAPSMFSVGYRNGEVVLQQQEHTEHLPHLVVTVDRTLARRSPGARGSVERLAYWWLALLRDHVSLAIGAMPVHTAGTPVGAAFQKVYARLDRPTGPVTGEEIAGAIAALSPSDREALSTAAWEVPERYQPDRVIIVYAPPAGRSAAHHEGEPGSAGLSAPAAPHHDETQPAALPPATSAPERGGPTGEPTPPAGEPAPAESVQRVGRYRIVLATYPSPPVAEQETEVTITVTEAAPETPGDGGDAPLAGAAVRGWFLQEGQEPPQVRPRAAHREEEAGLYGWHFRFAAAGPHRLVAEVTPPDTKSFRVTFPLAVAPAAAADAREANEEGATPREPAARGEESGNDHHAPSPTVAAPRIAPARERAHVEVVDERIEVTWQPAETTVKRVTVTLLDAKGQTLASHAVTAAPFTVRFPERARAYFSRGLARVQVTAEYKSGAREQVTTPISEKEAGA